MLPLCLSRRGHWQTADPRVVDYYVGRHPMLSNVNGSSGSGRLVEWCGPADTAYVESAVQLAVGVRSVKCSSAAAVGCLVGPAGIASPGVGIKHDPVTALVTAWPLTL